MISLLLANMYLHPLDRQMKQRGYRMVRYADDFVMLCRTAGSASGAGRSERLGRRKAGSSLILARRMWEIVGKPGKAWSFWAIASKLGCAG